MARPTVTLEELLVRHGALTDDQLAHAREEQAKWGGELGRTLVDLGYITEELLLRAISHQQRIPWVAPDDPAPPRHLSSALTLQLCERFGVVAVAGDLRARVLRVATSDPTNSTNLKALATASGFSIQPAAAMQEWIDRAIRVAYYGEAPAPAPGAAAEPPLVEVEEVSPGEELADLRARLDQLERRRVPPELASRLDRLERAQSEGASPDLAALVARVERLEQQGIEDSRAVRVISGILVDLGFITRAELQQRLKK